jgi:peptide/nickel transport system substrate-binding protein
VAARQQRGGEALGPIAQHYIPPGMAGFEESNGVDGWTSEQDWMAKPEGDRTLSAEYFKKAGMASGKYEGDEEVLIVGDNADPDKSIAQITEQQLNEMGFKTKLRLVTRDTMFTKFCNVPKSEVNVCPSVGWLQDFADPQTMLDPTFNGENIIPSQNSNWPELDVPALNKQIDEAKLVTDPAERAKAWAAVNKAIVDQAPAIPYMWDYQSLAISPNMRGVQNGYSTIWDFNFTSMK